VILGWTLLGVLHKADDTPAAPKAPMEGRSIPGWAPGLDETSLDGWIEVQTRFRLPGDTLRSAIQILRADDKYPSAHQLHDLSRHPVQVARAFSLLAGLQPSAPPDLGALQKDLEGRLVGGVRFPDEPPGGRYSPMNREMYNNTVVLAIIDLLHRRQGDPGMKEILAALRRGRT